MEISSQLQVPAALLSGKGSHYGEWEAGWPPEQAGRSDKEKSPSRVSNPDTMLWMFLRILGFIFADRNNLKWFNPEDGGSTFLQNIGNYL
jgi:hypothetical protein